MTRKKTKTAKTKTLVDVVIPAGSEAIHEPYVRVERNDYVSVLISHDKHTTSEWLIPREDAIRLGIIPGSFEEGEELPENLA